MPQHGDTPLHVAAGMGHVAVVGALLAAKANIEAKNTVRGGGRGGASKASQSGAGRFIGVFWVGIGLDWIRAMDIHQAENKVRREGGTLPAGPVSPGWVGVLDWFGIGFI